MARVQKAAAAAAAQPDGTAGMVCPSCGFGAPAEAEPAAEEAAAGAESDGAASEEEVCARARLRLSVKLAAALTGA